MVQEINDKAKFNIQECSDDNQDIDSIECTCDEGFEKDEAGQCVIADESANTSPGHNDIQNDGAQTNSQNPFGIPNLEYVNPATSSVIFSEGDTMLEKIDLDFWKGFLADNESLEETLENIEQLAETKIHHIDNYICNFGRYIEKPQMEVLEDSWQISSTTGCDDNSQEEFSLSFDPNGSALNYGNAFLLANLSKTIQELDDTQAIYDYLFSQGFKKAAQVSLTHSKTFAIVAKHTDYIIVIFAGTLDTAGMMSNLEFAHVETEFLETKVKAHQGFLESYEILWPMIEEYIKELGNSNPEKVFFAGHSRGGALATLSAIKFLEVFSSQSVVYTFGQPRVGDKQLQSLVDNKLPSFYRFGNNNDLVSHLPPTQESLELINEKWDFSSL